MPKTLTKPLPKAVPKSRTKAIDMRAMERAADDASELMGALAHRDRLKILCQLTHGSLCVSDIEEATGIRQPSLSQQLGILRSLGLVEGERDGKFIHYSIASREAARVIALLFELYCAKK